MSESGDGRAKILNFNVGVLGHVDSGKTSLARALSSIASTAAFDKNPQSRERGITLDLGFSSFKVDLPEHLRDCGGAQQYDSLQFTLVDCPGHASLIRTIIGGEISKVSASVCVSYTGYMMRPVNSRYVVHNIMCSNTSTFTES